MTKVANNPDLADADDVDADDQMNAPAKSQRSESENDPRMTMMTTKAMTTTNRKPDRSESKRRLSRR